MLSSNPGQRLQDFVAAAQRNPIRRFDVERPVIPVHRVRRMDPAAMRSVFRRLDRLAPISISSPLGMGRLAQSLTFGSPPSAHIPYKVAAAIRNLSYDTPENRFVKHVLREALALTYRFSSHPQLHDSMRRDGAQMQAILENLAASPVIAEAGHLANFRGPSQALAKPTDIETSFYFGIK